MMVSYFTYAPFIYTTSNKILLEYLKRFTPVPDAVINAPAYRPIVTPENDITLGQFVTAVRNGKWSNEVQYCRRVLWDGDDDGYDGLKLLLPYIKLSGTFSGLNAGDLLKYNGLVQIDIDKIKMQDLTEIKRKLSDSPYTIFACISPSGMGIKGAVRIPLTTSPPDTIGAFHKQAGERIEEYFNEIVHPYELDTSTSRLIEKNLFVSYDPTIYYNPNAELFPFSYVAPAPAAEKPQHRLIAPAPFVGGSIGDDITPAGWKKLYDKIDDLLPEMKFTKHPTKDKWVSPLGWGGRQETKSRNSGKTVAMLGSSGTGIVIIEDGANGGKKALQSYIKEYHQELDAVKFLKKECGEWSE